MKQIKDINKLKKGDRIVYIKGETIIHYEFLMNHPKNENYLLFLNTTSMNAEKIYIPHLTDKDSSFYIDYNSKDIYLNLTKYYQKRISFIQKFILKL